jgi:GPH family glycoside/pentoside/hexuronide:cation symporter
MVNALGGYIIFYYIFEGDLKTGAALAAMGANVFTVCAIACIPVMTWMAGRIGKVATLRFLIILGIVGAFSKFFLYSKEMPYLLFFSQALVAPLAAGFWTITTSMKADICDDDELNHGMRREGIFGSVGNWVLKVAMASTFFLSGLILELTGFNIELKGNQAPETLLWMRILFSTVPAFASIAALWLIGKYPLHEKRMLEIRAELEMRRECIDNEDAMAKE